MGAPWGPLHGRSGPGGIRRRALAPGGHARGPARRPAHRMVPPGGGGYGGRSTYSPVLPAPNVVHLPDRLSSTSQTTPFRPPASSIRDVSCPWPHPAPARLLGDDRRRAPAAVAMTAVPTARAHERADPSVLAPASRDIDGNGDELLAQWWSQ